MSQLLLASLLSDLQSLLLDDDAAAPAGELQTQQQILQHMLLACLSEPPATVTASVFISSSSSSTSAYPLLLSSLEQGYSEAARLLLLGQLLHQQNQQRHTPPKHPQCTHSSDDNDTPAVIWPDMVLKRLALLAQQPSHCNSSDDNNSSAPNIAVIALRLLSVAAAAEAACSCSSSRAAAVTEDLLLQQLLMRSSSTLDATGLTAACSTEGSQERTTNTNTNNTTTTGSSSNSEKMWPTPLGSDGIGAAAHLITSLALSAAGTKPSKHPTAAPQPVYAPAQDMSSTSSVNGCSDHANQPDLAATASEAAVSGTADLPVAAPTIINPTSAVKLLLQLVDGIQHSPPTAAAAAAHQPPLLESSPDMLLRLPHALSTGNPALGLQLQMLVETGDGQMAHCITALQGSSAAVQPARLDSGGAASASACAGKSCSAACCAACFDALRCMTVLVLQDTTGASATNLEVLQGVLGLVRQLVTNSPKVATQQLDAAGKPTSFTLAPSAAAPCMAARTAWSHKSQAATAAAVSAAVDAADAAAASATAAGHSALTPTSDDGGEAPHSISTSADSVAANTQQVTDPLLPSWHAPGVSQTYISWLQGWGLAAPSTTLEAALLLLLAVCQAGSWAAATALYAADVSSLLEQLCGFVASPAGVDRVLQQLYRCLCTFSSQLRGEVMLDARILALQGLIADAGAAPALPGAEPVARTPMTPPAVPLKLQAAAMSCLCSAVDSAPAAAFLAFIGAFAGGAQQGCKPPGNTKTNALKSGTAGSSSSSSMSAVGNGIKDWSTCGLGSVVKLLQGQMGSQAAQVGELQGASSGTPQAHKQQQQLARALLRDAQQVFLASINRARQMQHLTSKQLPRGGIWSTADSTLLRRLEAWCLNPVAAEAPGSLLNPDAGGSSTGPAANTGGISGAGDGGVAASVGASSMPRRSSSSSSVGRRRAGSAAVSGRAVAGRNAADPGPSNETGAGREAAEYDEDGLREVWSSGPSAATLAARAAWKQLQLSEAVSWTQSSSDLELRLLLPAGTRKQDLVVSMQPDRLTVRLNWYGRVLDGPLKQRIKSGEACWSLDSCVEINLTAIKAARGQQTMTPSVSSASVADHTSSAAAAAAAAGGGGGDRHAGMSRSAGSGSGSAEEGPGVVAMAELLVILPKEQAGKYWRALFDGGEEKSHLQVLQEALSSEDDARHAPTVDQLGPEAALLLEELRERQELMVSGQWRIEHSFDDFRLVLGDNMM